MSGVSLLSHQPGWTRNALALLDHREETRRVRPQFRRFVGS